MLAENFGSCCCNAVPSNECGVCCESCPMLGICTKTKTNFWVSQVRGVYSVFVGLVTRLCSLSNACVESGHTLWAYIKLAFCLHQARHILSSLILVWFCCKTKYLLQWNPSIMDTLGTQNCVRYNEVSLSQGLTVYFRAVEHNVAVFSELSFAVRRQGILSRG